MKFIIKENSVWLFSWSINIYQLENLFEIMEHCNICPSLSFWEFIISILFFLKKSIATPEPLEMVWECQMNFPFHSFFQFLIDSGFECVACKKLISTFLLINKSQAWCLLLSSCNLAIFSVVICSWVFLLENHCYGWICQSICDMVMWFYLSWL